MHASKVISLNSSRKEAAAATEAAKPFADQPASEADL
jgi:hypothetical protein